jgi:phage shock protein E
LSPSAPPEARKEHAMKSILVASVVWMTATAALAAPPPAAQAPTNPAIDMVGFLNISLQAAQHRESRRIAEAEFIRMSREPGTVVLDARSAQRYDELHVKGAINLSFPDITVESLARTIPDKKTRILIYCNNNFRNAEGPFPSKLPSASLNLSTYIALYNHGYREIYELADTLDLKRSKLPWASSAKPRPPR